MNQNLNMANQEQANRIQQYYRLQSKIYDATRWAFLFGRLDIIRSLPFPKDTPLSILEVGSGTGYNLLNLARKFPKAQLTGIDVSKDMIRIAGQSLKNYSQRVNLIEAPYSLGSDRFSGQMDIILFSYSLTMINPQWEDLISQAHHDLKPGGMIAVTDFHNSRFSWFKNHMGNHHVRMDSHLLPVLQEKFQPELEKTGNAYGGIWTYFLFLGTKT